MDEPIAALPDDKPTSPLSLNEITTMFKDAVTAADENNLLCIRDRDYFDGDQIDTQTRAKLKKRGQPVHVINLIAPAVNGLLGIVDASETDPEAMPRNPDVAQNAADIATKTLRFIADKARFTTVRAVYSTDLVILGTCAVIVHATPSDITCHPIRWEDFFFDPQSRDLDFSDAQFLGKAVWLSEKQVRAMFPNPVDDWASPFGSASIADKGDLQSRREFIKSDPKVLRVIELYWFDGLGQWHQIIFHEGGILHYEPCAYLDDQGRSICPIIAQSFEIKQNNDRYGAVRNMIPLQDDINARRSRALWAVNSRGVRQVDLNVPAASLDQARAEAAKPDGVLPYGFDIVPTQDLTAGQMSLLQQSMSDLARLAPTPAVLGRVDGSNESGRSRAMLQQAGMTEWSRFTKRVGDFEQRIFDHFWFGARQFFDGPMWIRVTGENRAPEFIKVNEPIMGIVQQPVVDPATGQPMLDPMTGQPMMQSGPGVVGMNNRLAEMDVDIVITRVADTVTLEQEVWAEIMRYAASAGLSPFDPAFEMLLELSPLPNKTRTMERIAAIKEKQAASMQAQEQMAQQQAELGAQAVQAKTQRDLMAAEKNKAEAIQTAAETVMLNSLDEPPTPEWNIFS